MRDSDGVCADGGILTVAKIEAERRYGSSAVPRTHLVPSTETHGMH